MDATLLTAIFSLGLGGGFLSGLLGIGGGVLIFPLLLLVPPALGLAPLAVKAAAAITAVQSFRRSVRRTRPPSASQDQLSVGALVRCPHGGRGIRRVGRFPLRAGGLDRVHLFAHGRSRSGIDAVAGAARSGG